MSEFSCFISDGYTEETTIPAVAGLHPALAIKFRPALPEERFEFLRAQDLNGKQQSTRTAKMLKEHLVSWDAQRGDKAGETKTADITEELLRSLRPTLMNKLADIVMGYTPVQAEGAAGN